MRTFGTKLWWGCAAVLLCAGCITACDTGPGGGTAFELVGRVDSDFATDGYLEFPDRSIYALAEGADGSIFVGGENHNTPSSGWLAKVSTSGALVSSFGSGGQVSLDLPGDGAVYVRAIMALHDGSILVGGDYQDGADRDLFVAKLSSSGNPASTFGSSDGESLNNSGISTHGGGLNDYAYDMARMSNGTIVLLYQQDDNLHTSVLAFAANGLGINAFDQVEGGPLDSRIMPIQYNGTSAEYTSTRLEYHNDGFWLSFLRKDGSTYEPTLVRLLSNGRFDPAYFGGTGRTILPMDGREESSEPMYSRQGDQIFMGVKAWDTSFPDIYFPISSWNTLGEAREVFGVDREDDSYLVYHASTTPYLKGVQALGSGKSAVLISDDGEAPGAGTPRAWVSFHTSTGARDTSLGNDGLVFLDSAQVDVSSANGLRLLSSGRLLLIGQGGPAWLARIE